MNTYMDRRRFIGSVLLAGPGLVAARAVRAAEPMGASAAEEEVVTPGEDLMREHGVLRRLLLVYEEINRRNRRGDSQMKALLDASGLIRSFVEDYHEKLEENYIFPRFDKAGKQVDLVKTLLAQHQAGRKVTARISAIASANSAEGTTRQELSKLIHMFVRMYRPHAAREDTVLFREFPDVVGRSGYAELGEKFEDKEHELFGPSGFVSIVDKVAAIEKGLGIYDLSEFTPKM